MLLLCDGFNKVHCSFFGFLEGDNWGIVEQSFSFLTIQRNCQLHHSEWLGSIREVDWFIQQRSDIQHQPNDMEYRQQTPNRNGDWKLSHSTLRQYQHKKLKDAERRSVVADEVCLSRGVLRALVIRSKCTFGTQKAPSNIAHVGVLGAPSAVNCDEHPRRLGRLQGVWQTPPLFFAVHDHRP